MDITSSTSFLMESSFSWTSPHQGYHLFNTSYSIHQYIQYSMIRNSYTLYCPIHPLRAQFVIEDINSSPYFFMASTFSWTSSHQGYLHFNSILYILRFILFTQTLSWRISLLHYLSSRNQPFHGHLPIKDISTSIVYCIFSDSSSSRKLCHGGYHFFIIFPHGINLFMDIFPSRISPLQ